MKHILFMLLTGLCMGQLVSVSFNNKIFKIVDYKWYGSFRKPFNYHVILINNYGDIEPCTSNMIQNLFSIKRAHWEYEAVIRTFNISK